MDAYLSHCVHHLPPIPAIRCHHKGRKFICFVQCHNPRDGYRGSQVIPAETWMDLEIVILSEVNQTKRNI